MSNNSNEVEQEEEENRKIIGDLTFQQYIRLKLKLTESSISDKSIENYILLYCLYCKLPCFLLLLVIPNDEPQFSCSYFYKYGRKILSHLKPNKEKVIKELLEKDLPQKFTLKLPPRSDTFGEAYSERAPQRKKVSGGGGGKKRKRGKLTNNKRKKKK